MSSNNVKCRWCNFEGDVGELIGPRTCSCPKCGNPVLPAEFGTLALGRDFVCVNGGKWKKVNNVAAKCVEPDSAFVDEVCAFKQREIVYPIDHDLIF